MPTRFGEDGNELTNCVDATGARTWGAKCTEILLGYAAAKRIGVLPLYDSVETRDLPNNIVCHESNDAALPTFTGTANCDWALLDNGFYQW